jgi:hypothetical protein
MLKHVSKIKMHIFKSSLYYFNYNKFFYLCLISHVSKKKTWFIGEGPMFQVEELEFKYFPQYSSFFFNEKPCVHFIQKRR